MIEGNYYIYYVDGIPSGKGAGPNPESEGTVNIQVTKEFYEAYDTKNPEKYILVDNELLPNPSYENIVAEREKQAQRQILIEEIDELDKKRIRAICEPSEKEPGLTWLEYYNGQIADLREQLKNL